MTTPVQPNDPVTVLFLDAPRKARVDCIIGKPRNASGLTVFRCEMIAQRSVLVDRVLRDEGVTWIRGHHDLDSDDAKALIAANALGEETTFSVTVKLTK